MTNYVPNMLKVRVDSEILSNIVQVSAGYDHTCAVNKSDHVFCWGENDTWKLGIGAGFLRRNLKLISLILGTDITATQVSAGRDHTCALKANSKVACWGTERSQGQAGRGSAITGFTNWDSLRCF